MRLLLILLLTLNLLQAKKIALLIGNSQYSFQPLANPLNDVDGIYQTLDEIGFNNIKILKNASKSQMETALANFSQRAGSAEIALVYFSGHGMQVNNTNYMFPANTTAKKPVDLFGLVDLNYFIQSATSAKYGIVLVDACRNNPLLKYFQNGKHKGASAKKGLGQVEPTNGKVVIGFATSAGDTADDGNGNMSPYAKALSKRLKEKDDIRNILGKVADDVSKKYEQNPIYRANLDSSIFLNGTNSNQYNIKNLDGFALNFINNMDKNFCLNKLIKIPLFDHNKILTKDKIETMCKYLDFNNEKDEGMINAHITNMIRLDNLKEEYIYSSIKKIMKHHNIENLYEVHVITLKGDNNKTIDLYIIKENNKYFVIGFS